MATRLVNVKQALEKQIIPNRNRYAVGSEERAKFDDLLSRLRNAENEIQFDEVYKEFTGRTDLVDIDSLRENDTETRTGNGYQGPAEELHNKLREVDLLIRRGEDGSVINEVQSCVDSAEHILEELKNNGLNQDVITRFSNKLIPIKEKLENLRKTNGTSEVASSETVDIDSLSENDTVTRTGNGYQGPAEELHNKLREVDLLIRRGEDGSGINEVQSCIDSAEHILEELKNNGLNQDVITRFSNKLIPIKEKLENLRKTNGTSEVASSETVEFDEPVDIESEQETEFQKLDSATKELENLRVSAGQTTNPGELKKIQERAQAIYNDAFSSFSRNDDNDTLEQIASEHLGTINSNLEIALATQKFNEQTAEIEDLYKKAKKATTLNEVLELSDKAHKIREQIEKDNCDKKYKDKATELDVKIFSEVSRLKSELNKQLANLSQLENKVGKVNTVEEAQKIYVEAANIRNKYFDIKDVPKNFKDIADKHIFNIHNRYVNLRNELEVIKKLENLYKKIKTTSNQNEAYNISVESGRLLNEIEMHVNNHNKEHRDNAQKINYNIAKEWFRVNDEIKNKRKFLKDLTNEAYKAKTVEDVQAIYDKAAQFRDEHFDIKIVSPYQKSLADEEVNKIYKRLIELRKERDNAKGRVNVSSEMGDFEDEEEVIVVPDIEKDVKEVFGDKVKITIYNGKHQETFLIPRGTKIKEPLPAIPVDKNGKPKKLTAKEFDCWLDAYGNEIDFNDKVINDDFEIHASYKFDKKKALAVAAGAAVGGLAYVADLALPTPVPVISTVGSIGFKLGARVVNKKLANIQKSNNEHRKFTAQKIQDIQKPSSDILALLEIEKSLGHWKTFLNTAAIACGISAAAHGIKNTMDAKTQIIEEPVQPEPIVNEPIIQEPIIQEPIIQPEPQQVLGEFDPTIGKVYKTANSALSGTGAGNPYMPAYQGQEIYQAFFNGNRVMIQPGQSIESILQSVGASDISEVAVNVMSANGSPLTWQPLEALVEGISQVR